MLLVCLFAGCADVGKQRALETALAEFKRRGITMQSRWQITIDSDVRIQESGPQEVPIYGVNVYDPVESLQAPLYVIDIRRDTGAVDVFGKRTCAGTIVDTRGLTNRCSRRRAAVIFRFYMIKTIQPATTLGAAHRG